MIGSTIVYAGFAIATAGLILAIKPIQRLHVTSRSQGLATMGIGVLVAGIGVSVPTSESRVDKPETRLDEFMPAWQFHERHTIRVAASPERTFDAIRRVRANEISLFKTLTWIRRGGRNLPEGILNAGDTAALLDVATRNGFIYLANDAPQEVVIGTVVVAPPGGPGALTQQTFKTPLAPGFAVAAMNFAVSPDGPNASILSTETRVFANDADSRRKFARYWRVIYPGSAIIRRMWLRAVRRRATTPAAP
jgi:hypothetical protein